MFGNPLSYWSNTLTLYWTRYSLITRMNLIWRNYKICFFFPLIWQIIISLLLTNTAILVLLDVVPEGTILPRELVARVGLLDVRINKVAAGIGLEGGFALVLHERRLGGIGLQKLVEIPEAADHSEKALLGDNSEVKIMPGGVAQLRSRGISLVLGIGAALQEVKQCLDDISPLEEDLWREVLQIPRLEHRARLEHCLSIAELQRHGQVKEHLLILLGHEDERQLARLLQHLLLVHDLHMALVYS